MKIGYIQPHSSEATYESHRDLFRYTGYPNYHCKVMRDGGHECHLIALTKDKKLTKRHTHYNHHIHKFPVSFGQEFGREISISFIKNIINSDYDIIHFRGFKQNNVLPFIPIFSKYKPIVVQHLGSPTQYNSHTAKIGLRFLKYAHAVSAIDEKEVTNLKDTSISNSKLYYLPNAVNTDVFYPQNRQECKNDLGLDKEKRHILYVGRIVKNKGVLPLVKSISNISEVHPDIQLLLVGGGKESVIEDIQSIVDAEDTEDHIDMYGFVEQAKLPKLYNASDFAVFPSHSEGKSMVTLESAACKTPFIGTHAHESDNFTHGDTYVRIDEVSVDEISTKISFCLDNNNKISEIAAAAHNRIINQFGPDSIYGTVCSMYQDAIRRYNQK